MAIGTPDLQAIFNEALACKSDEERTQYIDRVCGADTELRGRIEALLRAHREAGGFFGGPDEATAFHALTERPGDAIGPYKLLQKIGEGGMGVVYMAEQSEPIERRVALKIIKPGMDTRQVIARFEAERQALAMMDHPNIARALDAGVTNTGRPYFVMELVRGVPLTEYCDEHQLTPRQRLQLFIPVCQAIQHAHQKGIIHRDIKPSNVLVAHYDDHAVPKVIDFGVAKAIDHRLTDKTMFTEFGQVLGTFEYMSPEQARLNQWDVDTRTDIYSLGVLLYELLAGETPFDRRRLRSAAFDELLRIIREEEPPRPSMRASTSQSLPTIAAKRKIEPKLLGAVIHGELDWIVMKALEKDRTRRYETASKLAEDVDHYLNNETVEACPPSASYRLRKFARRNKRLIATMSAIAAALLIGTGVATWQAVRASRERDRAVIAQAEARAAADRADEEAKRADLEAEKAVDEAHRAERQLERAEEVKDLLQQMLESAAPAVTLGADPTILIKILNETAERLEAGEIEDELVAAELHWTIGVVYEDLGRSEEALKHLTEAVNNYRTLRPDHIDTANVISHLGNVYHSVTNYTKAEELKKEALQRSRKHDERSIVTANIMGDLATTWAAQSKFQDAEQMNLDAVEILKEHIRKGRTQILLRNHLHGLGKVYLDTGKFYKAKEVLEESLDLMSDLPPDHPERLSTLGNLAVVLDHLGEHDAAEKLREETLESYERIVDEAHPSRLAAKHNLATSYRFRAERTGDRELRERSKLMYREIIDTGRKAPDSVYAVINSRINLARLLSEDGDFSGAVDLYEDIIDELKTNNDPRAFFYRVGLADIYKVWGFAKDDHVLLNKAKEICQDILAMETGKQAVVLPANERLAAKDILAKVYEHEGEYEAAMRLAREIVNEVNSSNTENPDDFITDPLTLYWMHKQAWMHHCQREFKDAERLYRQTLAGMLRNRAIDAELRFSTYANLGLTLLMRKKYREARNVLESCLMQMKQELAMNHRYTLNVMRWIPMTYVGLGDNEKAQQRFDEVLRVQDVHTLNLMAWDLLTHDHEELRDPVRALTFSQRACEIARSEKYDQLWDCLDTLALAQHENGDSATAVETLSEAIELFPDSMPKKKRAELVVRLEQYRLALTADVGESEDKSPRGVLTDGQPGNNQPSPKNIGSPP